MICEKAESAKLPAFFIVQGMGEGVARRGYKAAALSSASASWEEGSGAEVLG